MKLSVAKTAVWILGVGTFALVAVCLANQVLERLEADRFPAPGAMVNIGEGRIHVVEAGAGLDTSVPNQVAFAGLPGNDPLAGIAHILGWVRLMVMAEELLTPPEAGVPVPPEAQIVLVERNLGNATVRNETDHAAANFQAHGNLRYPAGLPVLLILAKESQDLSRTNAWKEDWLGLHQALLVDTARQEVQVMEGNHFIYEGNETAIAAAVAQVLAATPQ